VTKRTDVNDSFAILLVDATAEEVKRLRNDMPDWLWIEAPKDWPFEFENKPTDQPLDAIIVFAHRNKELRALEACNNICREKKMNGVPLLLAASRYQMSLANKVRRLPGGHFIFTPIDENSLSETINEIKGISS
jgi:hypothetical protein